MPLQPGTGGDRLRVVGLYLPPPKLRHRRVLHTPAEHGGQCFAPEAQPEHGNVLLYRPPYKPQLVHYRRLVRVVRAVGRPERGDEGVVGGIGDWLALVGVVDFVRYATLL
jgi:hypothetical protein